MKRTGLTMVIVMLAAGVAFADQKTQLSKLPAAVRATVEAESKGATVKGISSEKENGKTVYELETLGPELLAHT